LNKLALAAASFAVILAAPASATSINFDTFPNGSPVPVSTAIGTQYASLGVTFSGTNGTITGVPTATDYSAGPAGANYSGNYLASIAVPTSYGNTILAQRYSVVTMQFSTAVNGVSFSYNNFAGSQFQGSLNAYNANGVLLQNFVLTGGNGWEVKTLTAAGISRIDVIGAAVGGSTLIFGIDQLNFTPVATAAVPEPASWAMMIGGFGLVGGAMRRRRSARTTVRFA
jgi:hypothetical protein